MLLTTTPSEANVPTTSIAKRFQDDFERKYLHNQKAAPPIPPTIQRKPMNMGDKSIRLSFRARDR